MSKNEMQDNEKVTEFDFTDLRWKYDGTQRAFNTVMFIISTIIGIGEAVVYS